MNYKYILFPIALLLIFGKLARSFYKCKQVTFCDRLRNKKISSKKYFVLNNFVVHNSSVAASLVNVLTNKEFLLKLTLSADNIHLLINDPINPRHTVTDVVEETVQTNNITIVEEKDNKLITHGRHLISIQTNPFKIDIYSEDTLVVTINSNGLLTIEETEPEVGIALDFTFSQAKRTYGLPLRAENISLRTTVNSTNPYRLFNYDNYGYSSKSYDEALYGSVPVIYAHGFTKTVGLFWLNSAQTFVDINNKINDINAFFMSESGALDFFVLLGPSLSNCVKQYAALTGVAPLPQLFALGYHQSRYSYMSASEVKEVSNKFDESDLPLDTIWMDIDYTDNKKYFTWHPKNYSNPQVLLKFLENNGRKAVVIIDPHIKVDNNYTIYNECKTNNYFVKTSNNLDYEAKCWPGLSSWIDFFNPKARDYYANLHKDFANASNLNIWNDMNEPAIFETEEKTMPKTAVHYGGWKHRDVHNQYGFYQTLATYKGLIDKGVRPFILTRSHFAGSQRFAAIWTGDNVAEWSHLKISLPMCLTESLAGISFCGADVGGFVHAVDDELLQRWYQAGAWLPFYRGHSSFDVPHREPYLYNKEIQKRIRNSLQQRYKHLPYWYTLFWRHYTISEPVIRPLVYHYPADENVVDMDDQFLVGSDILVHPITDPQCEKVEIYLPGGDDQIWYNIERGRRFSGNPNITLLVDLDTTPVFYRGGSIITMKETIQKSSEYMKNDPITLHIFLDIEGNAAGTLYDDDTKSFDYLKGKYTYVGFNYKNNSLKNHLINRGAFYNKPTLLNSVVLYGVQSTIQHAFVKGDDEMLNSDVRVLNDKVKKCMRIVNLIIDIRNHFVINFD